MQKKLSQHDDSLQSNGAHIVYNMCSDALDKNLAYGTAKMALSLLQQQQGMIDPKQNMHDSIFHAIFVLMHCLSDYDDILDFPDHMKSNICGLLKNYFLKNHQILLPKFYYENNRRRREEGKPPSLNDKGKKLMELAYALKRRDPFYKALYKKLRHIEKTWKAASRIKQETAYDLNAKAMTYQFQFEEKIASGHFSEVYSGGFISDIPVIAKKIGYRADAFMREWSALDLLHQHNLLGGRYFPQILGVMPEQKTFLIKQYKPLIGKDIKNRKIVKGTYSDAQLKQYVQDIYEVTSLLLNHQIRHNDMHLRNLVYDENSELKIIDFGMLTQLSDDDHDYFGLMDYKRQYLHDCERYQYLGMKSRSFKEFAGDAHKHNALYNNPASLIQMFLEASENQNHIAIEKCNALLEAERKLYLIHMALLCDADGERITGEGFPEGLYQLFIKRSGWQKQFLKQAQVIAADIKLQWHALEDYI